MKSFNGKRRVMF